MTEYTRIAERARAQVAPKRVLIACEYSGIVRDAFIAAGHDAISCDLHCPLNGPARTTRATCGNCCGNRGIWLSHIRRVRIAGILGMPSPKRRCPISLEQIY